MYICIDGYIGLCMCMCVRTIKRTKLTRISVLSKNITLRASRVYSCVRTYVRTYVRACLHACICVSLMSSTIYIFIDSYACIYTASRIYGMLFHTSSSVILLYLQNLYNCMVLLSFLFS